MEKCGLDSSSGEYGPQEGWCELGSGPSNFQPSRAATVFPRTAKLRLLCYNQHRSTLKLYLYFPGYSTVSLAVIITRHHLFISSLYTSSICACVSFRSSIFARDTAAFHQTCFRDCLLTYRICWLRFLLLSLFSPYEYRNSTTIYRVGFLAHPIQFTINPNTYWTSQCRD